MKRMIRATSCLGFVALLSFAFLAGCNQPKNSGKDAASTAKDGAKDKGTAPHDHSDSGPHGGPIAEWGNDEFHAEFTIDHATKTATIYVLDDKAKKAPKIDPAKISKVQLSITSVKPFITIDLTYDPKKSDDKGIAFTGTHDSFAKPTELKGVIDGSVDGKPPYSGEFKYKPAAKTKAAMLREMFLTPGGAYTVADIKANGNKTPTEKFKGKNLAMHDANAKAGDPVCPITGKLAQSECAWTVKGQEYHFCCPPCLNQFIDWAHHQPEKIKDAREYVARGS